MLVCFLCGHDQEINVIRVKVKTRTLFGSDRARWGWKEQVNVPLWDAKFLSLSLSLSCFVGCPLLCSQTDGRDIRNGIFRNERSKIIISDIWIQSLVQASTRASKSIQANLDPSSHSLSFSRLFLFKAPWITARQNHLNQFTGCRAHPQHKDTLV